jgi:8-oxo-dGTP pyrophosphatase MutT (NUDIX family)
MRKSLAAVALICRQQAGPTEWLAQWNPSWRCYNFVGGHKLPEETFHQCLVREVQEELDLLAGRDYVVAAKPLAQLDYAAWSQSAGQETLYSMALFDVQLIGAAAGQQIAADPRNRWLTEAEIKAKLASDGQAVSDTMQLLLYKANLFST